MLPLLEQIEQVLLRVSADQRLPAEGVCVSELPIASKNGLLPLDQIRRQDAQAGFITEMELSARDCHSTNSSNCFSQFSSDIVSILMLIFLYDLKLSIIYKQDRYKFLVSLSRYINLLFCFAGRHKQEKYKI